MFVNTHEQHEENLAEKDEKVSSANLKHFSFGLTEPNLWTTKAVVLQQDFPQGQALKVSADAFSEVDDVARCNLVIQGTGCGKAATETSKARSIRQEKL